MSAIRAVVPLQTGTLDGPETASAQCANERSVPRIVAVDGRPLVRSGLARLAHAALDSPASAVADLKQATAVLRTIDPPPRALLIGVRSGDDPVERVSDARRLGIPIVLVLDGDDAELVRAALSASADGYLVLDLADADSIRETVEAIEAGEPAVPPELRGSCQQRGRREPVVTVRCLEVLCSLADGLHDQEIADRLGISTSSVRKHIGSAQTRLRARTRTQAVATAAQRGLL
jgi:DNA-binding NarL/FixJ family response regulator